MQQMSMAGIYLVQSVVSFYTLIVFLRFLLQLSRADFYNPVSQFVVKATAPVLNPLRRIIPGWGGLDIASLVLILVLQVSQLIAIILMMGYALPNIGLLIAWSAVGLFGLVLNFYFWAIMIQVILSWVAPMSHNPAVSLIFQVTEPVMGYARKLIPPMGGMDFSPIIVFMVIQLLKILVLGSLIQALGVPQQLILGL
ncbi:MAG TPA: YggT family protein [Pseudomonadales bacterium]|nr:YggT family protein [Pseudomonadales bacterium]